MYDSLYEGFYQIRTKDFVHGELQRNQNHLGDNKATYIVWEQRKDKSDEWPKNWPNNYNNEQKVLPITSTKEVHGKAWFRL